MVNGQLKSILTEFGFKEIELEKPFDSIVNINKLEDAGTRFSMKNRTLMNGIRSYKQIQLSVDFMFDDSKAQRPLYEVSCHVPGKSADSVYKLIRKYLGDPTTSVKGNNCNYLGYNWNLKSGQTIRLQHPFDDKDYGFIAINDSITLECDSIGYYERLKELNSYGKGNGKLVANIKYLENLFLKPYYVKDLQLTLKEWEKTVDEEVKYEYNPKTKEFDLPLYTTVYKSCDNINCNYIEITFKGDMRLRTLIMHINEYFLEDKIVPQLKAAGYSYAKWPTRLRNSFDPFHRTIYLSNPKNKLTISITWVRDMDYKIGISK